MKTTAPTMIDLVLLAHSKKVAEARNGFKQILMRLEMKDGRVIRLLMYCRTLAYRRGCLDKPAFAEDLHQRTLEIAFKIVKSFFPKGETEGQQLNSFVSWLCGIAKRTSFKLIKEVEPERQSFNKSEDIHWKENFRTILSVDGEYSDERIEQVLQRTYPPRINKMPYRINKHTRDLGSDEEPDLDLFNEPDSGGEAVKPPKSEEELLLDEDELLANISAETCEHHQEWNVAEEIFSDLKQRHQELSELDDLQKQLLLEWLQSQSQMHRECIKMYLKYEIQKATSEDLDNFCAKWKIQRGTPRVIFGRKVKQLRRKYEKLRKARGL